MTEVEEKIIQMCTKNGQIQPLDVKSIEFPYYLFDEEKRSCKIAGKILAENFPNIEEGMVNNASIFVCSEYLKLLDGKEKLKKLEMTCLSVNDDALDEVHRVMIMCPQIKFTLSEKILPKPIAVQIAIDQKATMKRVFDRLAEIENKLDLLVERRVKKQKMNENE